MSVSSSGYFYGSKIPVGQKTSKTSKTPNTKMSKRQAKRKRGQKSPEAKAGEILDFKNGKYRVRWVGSTRANWVDEDSLGRPKEVSKFWSQKCRVLKRRLSAEVAKVRRLDRSNQGSMHVARKSQSSLLDARRVLEATLTRESARAGTSKREMEISEMVVVDQQNKLAEMRKDIEHQERVIIAKNEEIRSKDKTIENLQNRLNTFRPAKGIDGLIIQYDASLDEYRVSNPTTLKITKHSSNEFGQNFRDCTIFWLRALVNRGISKYIA